MDFHQKYDLVSVCELCYQEFLQITKRKKENLNNISQEKSISTKYFKPKSNKQKFRGI